jgi:hypothetical protein
MHVVCVCNQQREQAMSGVICGRRPTLIVSHEHKIRKAIRKKVEAKLFDIDVSVTVTGQRTELWRS